MADDDGNKGDGRPDDAVRPTPAAAGVGAAAVARPFLRYVLQSFVTVFVLGALYLLAARSEALGGSALMRDVEIVLMLVFGAAVLLVLGVASIAWLAGESGSGFVGDLLSVAPNAFSGRFVGVVLALLALNWAGSAADDLLAENAPSAEAKQTIGERAGGLWRRLRGAD